MTNLLMRNKVNNSATRVPQVRLPRSIFPVNFSRKQTQLGSYLTPIFYQEVLPGDTWQINMSSFCRMMTQLTAPLDNLWVKTYFFFDPHRLQWENFPKQHGERKNPDDTIDYLTPTITYPNGIPYKSLADYLGRTRCGIKNTKMTSLGHRMYNRVINNYFRSERLQDSLYENDTDQDDVPENYSLFRIGKDRDYFTNCLPDLQLGEQVNIPLGTTAPVIGNGTTIGVTTGDGIYGGLQTNRGAASGGYTVAMPNTAQYGQPLGQAHQDGSSLREFYGLGLTDDPTKSGIYADLSKAMSAKISAMRLAIDTQEILERDNRNGTRYTEQLEGRYGCLNPDLLMYRPMYLGGTSAPLFTTPVVQTSSSTTTSAQGNITGFGTSSDRGEVIRASFGEFGAIMGLAVIKAVPQYQQGMGKCWERMERYDYYYPEFNGLSDQVVENGEIFYQGTDEDKEPFGYIPRYDDYRMFNNEICGELRSEYENTLDIWHYAEKFETLPKLNEDFIQDKTNEIVKRTIAVQQDGETDAEQFLCDFQFTGSVTRVMPSHGKPQTGGSIL